jgi:peptidyl-prolyl cis-trans isomerase B (cyclophilin B)
MILENSIKIELTIKGAGVIALELDTQNTPITTENFVNLVNEKFYDGLTFHRIIKGFMIQGGDPQGTGMGGSKNTIKGEFSLNGVKNPISHTRGTISMARSQMMDSASSQFFICDADATFLDGQYAAFGKVTSGLEVVDLVAKTPVVDRNGTVPKENQPVIESIRVIK